MTEPGSAESRQCRVSTFPPLSAAKCVYGQEGYASIAAALPFSLNASFHCEHITPREAGGDTTLNNLAWACPWCNAHKYTKTRASDPQTGRVVPLFNPRRQRWERHFAWGEDFIVVLGRTAIGRAAVVALHLNRPELLNLRRLLRTAGEHPHGTE